MLVTRKLTSAAAYQYLVGRTFTTKVRLRDLYKKKRERIRAN